MYSFRIEQAIRAASILHKNQMRKGAAPYPYISHLFAVSCIIADYTDDEDIIVAGLLHDTLEDTGYTEDELETDFGERVRMIVRNVSERTDPKDPRQWLERKTSFIELLKDAPEEALVVAAADAIHNLRSIVEEYQGNIAGFLNDFNGTLEDRVTFYEQKSLIFNARLQNDILNEFNHVYNEFRAFSHT